MMCLGKNWDPQKRVYEDIRSIDGAKPPIIPAYFNQLVREAIKDSHALIGNNSVAQNVETILPMISPDICIVNFYKASGKLGLHQVCIGKLYHPYYSSHIITWVFCFMHHTEVCFMCYSE